MTETSQTTSEDIPVVGRREPCPCGSGKRYKQCHGNKRGAAAPAPVNRRTFEGLPGECDFVAMREIVPAATARVKVREEFGGHELDLATVLPMVVPALRRTDGARFVALQVMNSSGDVSRDLGAAVKAVCDVEPGTPVQQINATPDSPRLQDVLELDSAPAITLYESFEFWAAEESEDMNAAISQASEKIVPTDRLVEVEAAYWCRIGEREHLRWVLPDDEERVLDALARLHAKGENTFGEGSRFLGAFRAHGLVAPVWDLPTGWSADDTEDPAKAWFERYSEALGDTSDLTAEQRRARAGIVSRQLTLR